MGDFDGHYTQWRESRLNGLDKYLVDDFFNGKKVLELGCARADIAYTLQNKGANVTGCDGRQENLTLANTFYPSVNTFLWDGEKDPIPEYYTVIVHQGLLYHLNKDSLQTHLTNVLSNCDVLILESEVCDSSDLDVFEAYEIGYDQALNGVGSRPSESFVEKILAENGFSFKSIKDSILNAVFHTYDWEITNSKEWKHGQRRFWICWKNGVDCPIKPELV